MSKASVTKVFSTVPATAKHKLPGIHLPLDFMKPARDYYGQHDKSGNGDGVTLYFDLFAAHWKSCGLQYLPMLTLREWAMLRTMNYVTDQLDWAVNVFDNSIIKKWIAEAISKEDIPISEKMIEYIIAELRWKATEFKKTNVITVYNGDVVKADKVLKPDLQTSIHSAVENLRTELRDNKDHKEFFQNPEEQVRALIDPSLWPLVYGRSRIVEDREMGLEDCIDRIGEGRIIPVPPAVKVGPGERNGFSNSFQWLPCEVKAYGEEVKVSTYINNLHPKRDKDLYNIIGKIITKAIPLWNSTLSGLQNCHNHDRRINFEILFDPDPDTMSEEEKPPREEGEDIADYINRLSDWEEKTRKVVLPEPEEFQEPKVHEDDVSCDLMGICKERGLQVIVYLEEIELSPEEPEFKGEEWCVDGQMNEHICATALYTLTATNLTPIPLSFRQQFNSTELDERALDYPQGVYEWLTEVYGCKDLDPMLQDVGSVVCRENRLITFPNGLLKRLGDFRLVDGSRKGSCVILRMMLVDTGMRIVSTANVPPLRKDWARGEVEGNGDVGEKEGRRSELMDWEEAKEMRVKLMKEREEFRIVHNALVEEHMIDLRF